MNGTATAFGAAASKDSVRETLVPATALISPHHHAPEFPFPSEPPQAGQAILCLMRFSHTPKMNLICSRAVSAIAGRHHHRSSARAIGGNRAAFRAIQNSIDKTRTPTVGGGPARTFAVGNFADPSRAGKTSRARNSAAAPQKSLRRINPFVHHHPPTHHEA